MENHDLVLRTAGAGNIALSHEALYRLGVRIYAEDKSHRRCGEIMDLLGTVSTTRAFALQGCCYVHLRKYAAALGMMQSVIQDRDYIIQQKEIMEEIILCDLLRYMAAIYRTGIPEVTDRNLSAAVKVLKLGLNSMQNRNFKKYFKEELRHYQKKLFGGYKYS